MSYADWCSRPVTCSTQNWIIFGESDMVSEDFAHKVMGDLSNFEGLSKNDLKVILKEGKKVVKGWGNGQEKRGKDVGCGSLNDGGVASLNPQG